MPQTVPNQKIFTIHKPHYTRDFLQIGNAEWQTVSADKKNLGRTALQLYLYLADNADDYTFALSQQAVENAVGIGRTSYDKYLKKLEDAGYIVWRHGNVYDFYTTPRPTNERTQHYKDKADDDELNFDDDYFAEKQDDPAARNELPPRDNPLPQNGKTLPPYNREIDNKYETDNGEIDNTDSGTLRVPAPADKSAAALTSNSETVIHISAEALQKQHEEALKRMKRYRR